MAWWLVRSSPERTVQVRALAGDTVLCSWERHLTLTVPLSIQEYKWVPANCWGKPNKLRGNDRGNDLRCTNIPSRGSRNTSSRFMLQKPGISSGAMSHSALRLRFYHITCNPSDSSTHRSCRKTVGIYSRCHQASVFNTKLISLAYFPVCFDRHSHLKYLG